MYLRKYLDKNDLELSVVKSLETFRKNYRFFVHSIDYEPSYMCSYCVTGYDIIECFKKLSKRITADEKDIDNINVSKESIFRTMLREL